MMNDDERAILTQLEVLVQRPAVGAVLDAIAERVLASLLASPDAVMAWEPVPLDVYEKALPGDIRSSWIFVLRAGVATGPERHPNSRQRMRSYRGEGDLQTRARLDEPWSGQELLSDPAAPLEQRWISIPPNVWHQTVTPARGHWTVVSFHTCLAGELIEERPLPDDPGASRRRRYLEGDD